MGVKSIAGASVCASLAVIVLWMPDARAQTRRVIPGINPTTLTDLRAQNDRVTRLLRRGDLRHAVALESGLVGFVEP